jgi:GntR family carbon starvation induced transcriptional regulator
MAKPSTVSAAALDRLQRDIVDGTLAPSRKLKLRELAESYGIGATPLREALVQLAATGFVHLEGQKGFRVPPTSRAELLDITRSRQIVEAEAFRLAIEHGDAGWEDEIVASFHLLRRSLARDGLGSEAALDAYEERHHRFHRALIAACPLGTLKGFCDGLYIRTTRYRRLLKSSGHVWEGGPRQARDIAGHEALMEVALARDAAAAMPLLRRHIATTVNAVLTVLDAAD